jgi:phage recombination protein Bet
MTTQQLEKAATPEALTKRGITEAQWRTLANSLFPGASPNSVLLVWDYCVARKLDPLKKPCHIVPMEVKNSQGKYEWRDVVMPGIYEHRTTAQRTGEYLGHSRPEYGDPVDFKGVKAPEWCELTAYRWNNAAARQIEFPVRVYFREVVATNKEGKPNARWARAPIQMLTKCAEAAALREAFPDEIGGEQTAEEMDGQRHIDVVEEAKGVSLPKPDGFDDWLTDMTAVADEGAELLAEAWKNTPQATREYLTTTDPGAWEALKTRAAQKVKGPANA